jgi:Amt family ammonium transporter
MRVTFLISITTFLVLIPWAQGLSVGTNNEVTVDGITTSAFIVMAITLTFSLISWFLFSWASKSIALSGALLAIISGAFLVIPFLQVLGPMAGIMVGIVTGFVAFMLQKKMNDGARNRPVIIAGSILGSAYVVLIIIVLTTSQISHVWDTGDGVGSWTGTAEGAEKTGFSNVFGNNIGFVFFFATIPCLIITELVIRRKR